MSKGQERRLTAFNCGLSMAERFEVLHQAHEGKVVRHGDAETAILGFGTVCIEATSPRGGKVPIWLNDVAFIPGMHTSILSVQQAQKAGFFMNI